MRRYGLAATSRASVYLYNTMDDLDALADGHRPVKQTFGDGRRRLGRHRTLHARTMDDLYRENILDHYRNPRNAGHIDHPARRPRASTRCAVTSWRSS